MSNPNFDPQASSNTLWYGDHEDVCLTDVVDGKAEADHEHTEYADTDHTHTGYASADHTHAGYAEANHEHTGYAASDHTHDGYAASSHTHEQASIPGLIAALASKAEATHDHTLAQIVGLVAALAAKADLVDGKVPASQLPSYVDDVIEGHLHNATTFYENISDDVSDTVEVVPESGKVYLDTNTNKSYRWSGTSYVEIPASLALGETSATAYRGDHGKTAYDHSQNGDVHVTAAQKTAWDGKAAGDHTHNNYAPSNHTHSVHPGDITVTKVNGPGVNLEATSTGAKSRIHKNASANADYGTIISDYDADGKRDYLTVRRGSYNTANKLLLTSEDADGGSPVSYQIYGDHNKPGILWTGKLYMSANQTVTPSKKLSECRTGWMLLWSDYDPDTAEAKDSEFHTTFIPRMTPTGETWAAKHFYFDIPRTSGSDITVVTSEKRILKGLYVHDDKLVGHAMNNQDTRTDVVLRAVYEF